MASSAMIIVTLAIGQFFAGDGSFMLRTSRTVATNAAAQEFFQLRKKHFMNCAVAPVFNLEANAGTMLFSGVTLSYTNLSNAGGGVETFNTVCKDLPANIPPLASTDLEIINNCLATQNRCNANQIPVLVDAGGNQVFPQGSGDGRDGNPLGASLCFKLDKDVANYQTATMRFVTFVSLPGQQEPLLQINRAMLPAPKKVQGDSITIKAVLPNGN